MMRTLITGSSKGIGLHLAYEFAKHGHDLILVARDEKLLREHAATIKLQYSVQVDYFVIDLSRPGSSANLVEMINYKKLEVECLINNAGIGDLGDFVDIGIERLNAILMLNIIALSELSHHYSQVFKTKGLGKILEVASTAGFLPGPRMAAYYASKAYVISLSQALAYELKGSGVNLSILCPGPTESHFMHSANMDGSYLQRGILGKMSAQKVATIAYRDFMRNKLFIIPGISNKILAFATRLSPTMISIRIAAFFHRK
jgi:short-subunit dehydrogenase